MNKTTALLVSMIIILAEPVVQGQVSINDSGAAPDPSAMFDVQSTDKGMLIPRLTSAQRNGISSPADGLLVYDITDSDFYFYDGTAWQQQRTELPRLISDTDGSTKVEVEKTTDDNSIRFTTNGVQRLLLSENIAGIPTLQYFDQNTVLGYQGVSLAGGSANTYLGYSAGLNSNGNENTFLGRGSGNQTTANQNVIVGNNSGAAASSASGSVLVGSSAGFSLTNGSNSICVGYSSGSGNPNGDNLYIGPTVGSTSIETGMLRIGIGSNPLLMASTTDISINGTLSLTDDFHLGDYKIRKKDGGLFLRLDLYGNVMFGVNVADEIFQAASDIIVDGDLQFNGTYHPLGIDGVIITCGSVDADGTLNTNAIHSPNIGTISRNSEGDYTINFSSLNYGDVALVTAFNNGSSSVNRYAQVKTLTSNSLELTIKNQNGDNRDAPFNFIIIAYSNNNYNN